MNQNHQPENAPEVVAFGAISLDNIVRLPAPPRASVPTPVTADYYVPGGALAVALPLSSWGRRVTLVGNRLGEDAYADFIVRELERYPVTLVGGVRRDPHVRTPFSRLLMTPEGATREVRYWFDQNEPTPLDAESARGARIVTLRAAIPGGVESATVARAAGATVVVSDVIRPDDPLLPLADWIITSRDRLRRAGPERDPEAALRELHEAGDGSTLVLTDRQRPVLLLDPDGRTVRVRPYPFSALDRVGAGDLFRAGLIHALLDGRDVADAVRFANAVAALWVVQPAGLKRPPTLDEIQRLQEERGGRTIVEISPRPEETICPLCRNVVTASLFEKHWQMDRRVVERLRERNPAWRRIDGACPRCVHEATREAGLTRANADAPSLAVDHPIYGSGEPHALPTGVRLRANPHYAGRGVTIAMLDSGFFPHPDLTEPENRIVTMVDATREPVVEDADFTVPAITSWHGLMTSVVAAGNGYLSQGYYAGIAREARLVLIKISDPLGRIHERDILRGLRWVAANHARYGIQVVNLSVGGDPGLRPDSELNRLVNALVDEGVVVVAAAGNMGRDDLVPPASAARAITVGGLDDRNTLDPETNRIWHSNWGRIGDNTVKPELLAPSIWLAAPVLPGTRIAEQNLILDSLWRAEEKSLPELVAASLLDLGLEPALLDEPPEALRLAILQKLIANKFVSPFYQHVDGTSFAAPIVSSVVAQMLEANPDLAPERIKTLLIATAQPLPDVPEFQQGYGYVRPGHAVAAALHERHGRFEPGELSPQIDNQEIRFIFHEPRARRVSVIGDWNEWDPTEQPMVEQEPGIWSHHMPLLPPGRYEYKFVVDGHRWLDDPENQRKAVDGYGGFNGVIVVDNAAAAAA